MQAYIRPYRSFGVMPINDGLTLVVVAWPYDAGTPVARGVLLAEEHRRDHAAADGGLVEGAPLTGRSG